MPSSESSRWSHVAVFLKWQGWVGIGAIAAILAIVVVLYSPARRYAPESLLLPHLDALDQDDAASYLTVLKNETRSIAPNGGPGVIAYREINLSDGAKLNLTPNDGATALPTWTIEALTLTVGSGVQITAFGEDGENGQPGDNGRAAPRDCTAGLNGENGQDGGRGRNGSNIVIRAHKLMLPSQSQLHIVASGGAGGAGGNGGNGGRGGRADRSDGCRGGNGGPSGNGGDGGGGGDGGNVIIRYASAYRHQDAPNELALDYGEVRDSIRFEGGAGKGGILGSGGTGGAGGPGRGSTILGGGQPAGSNGHSGVDGRHGEDGTAGSIDILIEQNTKASNVGDSRLGSHALAAEAIVSLWPQPALPRLLPRRNSRLDLVNDLSGDFLRVVFAALPKGFLHCRRFHS